MYEYKKVAVRLIFVHLTLKLSMFIFVNLLVIVPFIYLLLSYRLKLSFIVQFNIYYTSFVIFYKMNPQKNA